MPGKLMSNMRSDRSENLASVNGDRDIWSTKLGSPICTGIVTLSAEIPLGDDHSLVTRVTLDKQCYAVGLASGSIKFYTFTGDKVKLVYNLPPNDSETLSCTDLQFVPYKDYMSSERKHLMVATYASGHVKLWHYTAASTKSRLVTSFVEQKVLSPVERAPVNRDGKKMVVPNNQTMAVTVSLDGSRFVTGGEDSVIRVYDIVAKKEINKCFSTHSNDKMDGHRMRICALLYHPRGELEELYAHIFISGGWDDSVQIWDDRHSHSLWQYYGPHICGSDALDIDIEQNHIIISSWRRDKTILEVWRFNEDALHEYNETGEVNQSLPVYKQYTKSISSSLQDKSSPSMGYVAKWLTSQYIVFGGSNGNMLKIIDRATFNTVGTMSDLPNGVYSVAFNIPENVSEKRPIRISFCSGTKLYLIKLEKK